jgi:hypothetical protein
MPIKSSPLCSVGSNILETALQNYRLGSLKPIQFTLEKYEDLFNQILQKLIECCLPLTDQDIMLEGGNARDRAVMAVRHGLFVTAEQLFAEARLPLEYDELSSEGNLLYRSFLEQAQAYLDYCRGDFDKVYTRISEALAIDGILEEKYGYEILHIHRIQLLLNIVRTEALRMNYNRAIELAFRLLGYLGGTLEVLPFPGLWSSERVVQQRTEVVTATYAQIACEVAVILAGKNRQLAGELLANSKSYINLQTLNNYHPSVQTWFLLKQTFIDNHVDKFIEQASYFLAAGRLDTPLLWYATVVDLITICKDFNCLESELLKFEVAKDAENWQFFPASFLPLLGIQ